mmetsp:Transcript_27916/g.43344  ORF Transcript_27916/g.43344 Transcript_27916/m.43344 type:complete len:252 (+) Transcript_27916:414-1169(+)
MITDGLHLEQILNTNAKSTILVISRFIADHHTSLHRFLIGKSRTNAVWTLVHIQRCTDSMTGTMTVILTNFPESFACKDIQYKSRRVLRPNHAIDTNVTLQYTCVILFELRCTFPHVPRSRHVRGSVLILPPAINQNRFIHIQISHRLILLSAVVNNRTIGTDSRNSRETRFDVTRLPSPSGAQDDIKFNLADAAFFVLNFIFKPAHEFCHGDTVHDVCAAHALHLSFIFACLHWRHRILLVVQLLFGNNA